jgi:hypothetical protein
MGQENNNAGNSETNHQQAFEQSLKENNEKTKFAFDQVGTYCRTGTLDDGFVEVDLKAFREKGVMMRFVALSVIGVLTEEQLQEAREKNGLVNVAMNISSEEQFEKFKKFIANLNWND